MGLDGKSREYIHVLADCVKNFGLYPKDNENQPTEGL